MSTRPVSWSADFISSSFFHPHLSRQITFFSMITFQYENNCATVVLVLNYDVHLLNNSKNRFAKLINRKSQPRFVLLI